MTGRKQQQLIGAVILAALLTATAPTLSLAYQAMMRKAKKYGAEDCLFCHVYEDGDKGWNERGLWLMKERDRRRAEKIDVDWLKDYKPSEESEGESGGSEKKKEKPHP